MNDFNLKPEHQKILSEIIDEVLSNFAKEQRFFSADSLHYLRSRITEKAKEQIGEADITSVDVLLDLRHVEDIRFAFKVSIPKEKVDEHILSK